MVINTTVAGLNSMNKMECKEGGNTEVLNGAMTGLRGNLISPMSDCNSNNLPLPKENLFLCSTDSMHDCPDFLQDNSDYQWFLDYGYKDNNYLHHQSILSMSRSQDLVYYEDMSRNLDANLAEVDMDDFNREDIHSVLSSLPNIPGVEEREMFASVSGSMMVKFGFDESMSPHSSSQEEPNNGTSMCKSQPLFSPLHESYMPNTNLSVDSLDLTENDINLMVTCQGNKHNYTIAFEGSTIMGADDLENKDAGNSRSSMKECEKSSFENEFDKNQKHLQRYAQESSNGMTCSDSPFTTWSKIKKNSNENLQLRRHPSGNNNTTDNSTNDSGDHSGNHSSTVKSLSMPNLFRENQKNFSGLSMSVKFDKNDKSGGLNCEQKCIKLFDIQNSCNSKSVDHSTFGSCGQPPHNFSLLKLFIKQKSGSHEGMSNYTKDDSCTRYQNDEVNEQTLLENAKDYCMNEINKTRLNRSYGNIIENSLLKQHKFEDNRSNSGRQANENLPQKMEEKKLAGSENQIKVDFDSGHENKYCSDESTQENGSNTESAENLMCNCAKTPIHNDVKKTLTEKSIQTSKLFSVSHESAQKSKLKVPVYILYPNYSLPNLEFLKKKHYVQNIDFSKVFVRPQKFQAGGSQTSTPKKLEKRPFSVNDIETLKKTGFKHIRDWESLTFLLPKEYKQFLQEIPEIVSQLKDIKNPKEELVPLFCLSPPPNRKIKKRPMSCDLNTYTNEYRSSNYSSPSSGFRGSSTMLNSNNSSNISSPRNTNHNYDSECSYSRRSGSSTTSRQYSRNFSDAPPPRPPLPRGILRNNSLDNQQYNCKIQKENANKRYSMIEFSERMPDVNEKNARKRLAQNFSLHRSPSQGNRGEKFNEDSPQNMKNRVLESEDDFLYREQSKIQNDLKRLEELLEISAAFGENVESFTENDMLKLRSQVSRFLTMHKNLEKVSETLQTVDETTGNENSNDKAGNKFTENHSLSVKSQHTPHNTPEHKKQIKTGEYENDLNRKISKFIEVTNEQSSDDYNGSCDDTNGDYFGDENLGGLKKTVSFAERISIAAKNECEQMTIVRPVNLPISEESMESSLENSARSPLYTSTELLHKKELVFDVKTAVDKIIQLTEETQDDPTNLCLHHLCPSLYAVLSDGLKEEIDTPFGPIRNSVWSVIEASSQNGPMTQTLNELVQRLNRDDVFTEGLIKFNAFIFGLMNARALSGWFSYLRTRDGLLRKYYDSTGLFLMSNTAGAPVRVLVDQLINTLDPLSSYKFNLDLMYQTKLLHCSLQNINHLLEDADNNAFLTPTKQLMLMKLVQSIQNSISQVGEGKKSKHVLEELDEKTSDPSVASLLEKNKSVRTRQKVSKVRPRSGCDILGPGKDITDVTTALQKRWSGVHANSKLVEAFDKLGNDSESDYTDSLDIQTPRKGSEKSTKNVSGIADKSGDLQDETNTKEQKKNILMNLNKKAGGSKIDCKTDNEVNDTSGNPNGNCLQKGGHKFKRLQQKWEKLSGRSDHESQKKSVTRSSGSSFEKVSCDINATNLNSPTSRTSKIPRLVTSPSSSSTPSIKGSKKVLSPTAIYATNNVQKTVKGNASSKGYSLYIEAKSSSASRLSRCDEKPTNGTSASGSVAKSHVTRPTSLPYRGSNTVSATKTEAISRRAASVSLNRKTTPKKLQVQRTVRTLTHRLPSDSGHLSFNEGEELKVVLEVDKTWLLCCRGTQKGLVPKSAVISDLEF